MVKLIRRFGLGRLMDASRISAALTTQHGVARGPGNLEWKPGKSVVLVLSMRLFGVAFAIYGLRNVGRTLGMSRDASMYNKGHCWRLAGST